MAEIYKKIPGKGGGKIQKVIAEHDGVQDWLDEYIFHAAVRAEAILAEHRDQGHAFIEVEAGDIDRYLILNDERGQAAAMSIEYGRAPSTRERADGTVEESGGMEGLFILHKAVHLKMKNKLRGMR